MKAVVFDMDGVLYDTEKLCMDSWCEVAKEHHIPDMEMIFRRCIGTNSVDTARIVYDHYGENFPYEDFRKEADRTMRDSIETNGLPIKPGARELLEDLSNRQIPLALASSSSRKAIDWYLGLTGFTDYFRVIISGDMVKHSKPEPEIYLIACEKLGVNPEDTYAIEDSIHGICSAYRAGMKAIMVPDMIAPTEEMEQKATVILESLHAVKDYLGDK